MDRRIGWWLEKKVEGVQGKGMATGEGRDGMNGVCSANGKSVASSPKITHSTVNPISACSDCLTNLQMLHPTPSSHAAV